MIKFFRRIRQQLLTQNPPAQSSRAGKYLLYAIGEIVLVVIGILIALQINNWNEWKKERIRERTVLIDLAENLQININTMESNIENLKLLGRSSEIVLTTLDNKSPYSDTLQVHFHNARASKFEFFLSRTGYESYKDIGLHIVTNTALKKEILALFETIYPSFFSNYEMINGFVPNFDDHVVQNFIYSNNKLKPLDYQKLFTDHYYISWVRAYKEGRKDLIIMENSIKKETERVLAHINDELAKLQSANP